MLRFRKPQLIFVAILALVSLTCKLAQPEIAPPQTEDALPTVEPELDSVEVPKVIFNAPMYGVFDLGEPLKMEGSGTKMAPNPWRPTWAACRANKSGSSTSCTPGDGNHGRSFGLVGPPELCDDRIRTRTGLKADNGGGRDHIDLCGKVTKIESIRSCIMELAGIYLLQ